MRPIVSDRYAVLGSPIAHSKSPLLHRAAFGVRNVDATYDSCDVTSETLADFLLHCGPEWHGLSLTMPLKESIVPLLSDQDELSRLVGAVNTVVFTESGLVGYNTDVWGAQTAIAEVMNGRIPHSAVILGAGATARSCLAALFNLGTRTVTVLVRNPERASDIRRLADQLGVSLEVRAFDDALATVSDIVVSTVPTGVSLGSEVLDVMESACGFDVSYSPWPTPFASALESKGAEVGNGLVMLVWQAVRQQRIFATGKPDVPLMNEPQVVAAMFAAVGIERDGLLKE